ncbi:hypothetical protein MHYP_G00355410 [Metynnis hypsauchen]
MASSFVPVANTKSGFTIVTQVVPAGMDQYGPRTGGGESTGGLVKKLLKEEPKVFGTVQIMIGIMTFLFGIVKAVYAPNLAVFSGVTFWGSCLVRSSLVMNIISAVAAGIAIVLLSTGIAIEQTYRYYTCSYEYGSSGISGVLLVFSLFEFIICICTSAFACKATCCAESPAQAVHYLNTPETHNLAENV